VTTNERWDISTELEQNGRNIFVAGFLSGLVTYQIQETEHNDTATVATPATLNAPVLSTVFETMRVA
jgi:hypothetical protein